MASYMQEYKNWMKVILSICWNFTAKGANPSLRHA
jgi:hypothetical protein